MSSSLKCTNCGLVNFATEAACKRCGAPLAGYVPQQNAPANYQQMPPPGYVSPQAGGYAYPPPPFAVGPQGDGVWRDGSTLVVYREGVTLPDRCVKCNAPANGYTLKRKLFWHPPAFYLIILIAVLAYAIVAMIVRKSATVYVGLCETHRARRRNIIIAGVATLVLGILGIIFSIAENEPTYALFGGLMFLVGLILSIAGSRVVTPSKIDDRFAWLKGVDRDYLTQFPPWPGWS